MQKTRRRLIPRPRMTVLENPTKRGLVIILSHPFTFYFRAVLGKDNLPCEPWICYPSDKPSWECSKDRFYEEDREYLEDIEPQARHLAIQVVCNYGKRLEKRTQKVEKEEQSKVLQGSFPGFLV